MSANESQRALVVAHEIGHECIHAGSVACSAEDVDPSRSMEAAPVGLQRVEDYGAHERRELQANVFARAFLFPRSLARRMFVEQALTASDIAKQLDLPVPLVRQQILDVILLPPPPTDEDSESPLARPSRPDPAQDRAAAHRGTPFQLQAGPGTGKTKTLVKRILSLLDEGVDPASILVLTFSNRAAGELAERVSAAAPDKAPKIQSAFPRYGSISFVGGLRSSSFRRTRLSSIAAMQLLYQKKIHRPCRSFIFAIFGDSALI